MDPERQINSLPSPFLKEYSVGSRVIVQWEGACLECSWPEFNYQYHIWSPSPPGVIPEHKARSNPWIWLSVAQPPAKVKQGVGWGFYQRKNTGIGYVPDIWSTEFIPSTPWPPHIFGCSPKVSQHHWDISTGSEDLQWANKGPTESLLGSFALSLLSSWP